MRGVHSAVLRIVLIVIPALPALVTALGPARATQDSAPDRQIDPVEIFRDGFESGECSPWSASSNPLAAPDVDGDTFGDANQPTVY